MNNKIEGFMTRHAQSTRHDPENVSEQYPSLTKKGVEQASERAKEEIRELIEKSPEGAVLFLGAASDQERTKDTARVYSDTLDEMLNNKEINGVKLINEANIKELSKGKGVTHALEDIQEILSSESPDTKVVVNFPMQLKGLSYNFNERWTTKDGKKTEYFAEVLKKHNGDHNPAGLDWLENNGALQTEDGRALQGPNPTKVAEEYLEGLDRLRNFASKYTDRPLVIGGVGHQWDLDALVTYLSNEKKEVSIEDFKKVAGDEGRDMIDESEMFNFEINKDKVDVNYRGKKFEVKK